MLYISCKFRYLQKYTITWNIRGMDFVSEGLRLEGGFYAVFI